MTEALFLLFPTESPLPEDAITDAAETATVTATDDDGLPGYRVVWPDVTLELVELDDEAQATLLNNIQAQVDSLLSDRRDKKARKIWRRVERMVKVLGCTVEPVWDTRRKAQQIVQAVIAQYDYAYLFVGGALYNENGNLEVGPAECQPKLWAQDTPTEPESDLARARKQRSLATLRAEQVPTITHLPVIADEEQTKLRAQDAVARRAMALNLIARRADSESFNWYQQKVQQYRLQDAVTPDEWDFAEADDPPDYLVIKFSQRLESCWLLFWALSLVKTLHRPDRFCNADHAYEILDTRSPEQFLLDANLRSKTVILDAADLHYRYHWAVVDADLYGKKPPRGLEPVVAYERHYALNWLIGYQNHDWDTVTTDT